MAKLNLTRSGILVLAFLISGYIEGWTQSIQNSPPATVRTTSQAPVKKMTASDELIQYNTHSKSNNPKDLQLTLLQAKAKLETGIAANTLSTQQIEQMKIKIAALESRINMQSSKTLTNPKKTGSSTNVYRNILDSKRCTRNQFINLTANEQRQLLTSSNEIVITDLINSNPAMLNNRTANIIYVPASQFRNADVKRKQAMLNNPNSYVVVKDGIPLPKAKISQDRFDALPAAKKQAILDSGQYEITN